MSGRTTCWVLLLVALAPAVGPVAPAEGALWLHWAFDETTGSTAGDGSTHGLDGTLYGFSGTYRGTGVSGQALHFDGSDDYVRVELPSPTVTDFTVAFWARSDSTNQSQYTGLFNNNENFGSGGTADAFQVDFDASGGYDFFVSSEERHDIGPASTEWRHLAVTLAGTQVTTYYQGQAVASNALGSGMTSNNFRDFIAGTNRNGNSSYAGWLDDIQVYDTALGASQIEWLYDHPGQPVPAPAALPALAVGLAGLLRRRRR